MPNAKNFVDAMATLALRPRQPWSQGCQIWLSTANLAELEGGWPWNFSALGQPQIWPNLAECIRRIYINMKIYIGIHAHKILKILRNQFKIHIYRSILTVCT